MKLCKQGSDIIACNGSSLHVFRGGLPYLSATLPAQSSSELSDHNLNQIILAVDSSGLVICGSIGKSLARFDLPSKRWLGLISLDTIGLWSLGDRLFLSAKKADCLEGISFWQFELDAQGLLVNCQTRELPKPVLAEECADSWEDYNEYQEENDAPVVSDDSPLADLEEEPKNWISIISQANQYGIAVSELCRGLIYRFDRNTSSALRYTPLPERKIYPLATKDGLILSIAHSTGHSGLAAFSSTGECIGDINWVDGEYSLNFGPAELLSETRGIVVHNGCSLLEFEIQNQPGFSILCEEKSEHYSFPWHTGTYSLCALNENRFLAASFGEGILYFSRNSPDEPWESIELQTIEDLKIEEANNAREVSITEQDPARPLKFKNGTTSKLRLRLSYYCEKARPMALEISGSSVEKFLILPASARFGSEKIDFGITESGNYVAELPAPTIGTVKNKLVENGNQLWSGDLLLELEGAMWGKGDLELSLVIDSVKRTWKKQISVS